MRILQKSFDHIKVLSSSEQFLLFLIKSSHAYKEQQSDFKNIMQSLPLLHQPL